MTITTRQSLDSHRRHDSLIVAAGFALLAQVHTAAATNADDWIGTDASIAIQLQPESAVATLRIFLGTYDITALAAIDSQGRITLSPSLTRWPSGAAEIVVYSVRGDTWQEIHRQTLNVLTPRGFQTASIDPALAIKTKSQIDEGHYRDAPAPERARYTDVAGQGGVSWQLARGAFTHGAAFNFVGTSLRNEALRFGELGENAPLVDLSDYRIDAGVADLSVALGHVSYGNHPLLLNQMSSRGATVGYKFGQRADVSINSMNGTSMVGYDELLGLTSPDHRVNGATTGLELIASRPGALRIEATYLDASLLNQVDFNTGEIPDAELSEGWGLRVSGATANQRLRADLVWATSTYVNPFDPVIAQDGELQSVLSTRGEGRTADVSIDLLQNATLLSASQPLTITLTGHHERIDPLYKTIGTFLSADQEQNRTGLAAQLGGAAVQTQASRQEDNLDDIPTLLKTRTDSLSAALTLPFAQWLATHGGAWWPQVNYAWQHVHQLAINAPSVDDSGFAASQLPDQVSDQHQLNFAWSGGAWNVSYSLMRAEQDNRQPGRALADSENLAHQLSYGQQLPGGLTASLSITRARNFSVEQQLANYTTGGSIDVQWQPNEFWSIAANIGLNRTDDSRNFATSTADTGQLQINRSLAILFGAYRVPCQLFVRYAYQDIASTDNVFDFATDAVSWSVDAGLSMGLF